MDKVTDEGPFGDAQRRSVPETVTGTGRWLWGPGCQYTPPSLSWQWLRCPEGCCSGRLANTAAVLPMSEPGTSGPTPPSSVGKARAKAGPSGRGRQNTAGSAAYLQTLTLAVLFLGGFLQGCRVPGGGLHLPVLCVCLRLQRPQAALLSTDLQ